MCYGEALEFLTNLTKFGINLGLGRISELLKRLGGPHLGLRIVHVGGTNGKGSTSAMLASILKEAGYRTGAFTSPHLHSYTERFRINGVEIIPAVLAGLIEEIKPPLEDMVRDGYEHPTEFEVLTATAFLYFKRQEVDFLVMEVGLGGDIDSTNVANALLSVITNVTMDHMDYLGNSIEDIAMIKAGIIKPGIPVITAAEGAALEVIEKVCRKKNCRLVLIGRDVKWEQISASVEGQDFTIRGLKDEYRDLKLFLLGRHQLVNAATVVAAVEILTEKGAVISPADIQKGLAAARWPGRFEIMCRDPLVVIDGAHNLEGARSLRRVLEEIFPGHGMVLVIGVLGDKEREKVVSELAPLARAVVVTRPNSPRAGNWRELAVEAGRYVSEVYLKESIAEALNQAVSLARPGEMVCITGSLYMIAEARELILKNSLSK